MKIASNIAGGLLGFLFVALSLVYFFKLYTPPEPPAPGSPTAMFMGAFFQTGYMDFVKCFEILGGILVAIPKTRNFGLLVLGPIIINILAFHTFVEKGKDLVNPIIILIVLLAGFLLWSGRKAFAGLLR
jgi:hypothetical protein